MGRDTVPILVAALEDDSWYIRSQAALALGMMGAQAQDAVPGLAAALADPVGVVRDRSAEALERIGSSQNGASR